MCGIAGIIMQDVSRCADSDVAKRMANSMLHRGPDAGGVWASGPIALGHRRLKIIDLTDRAAQPMCTPDGRFVVVFNGEIYNFRQLRRMLEGKGVSFRSNSDTEVLLHLYVVAGQAMLEKLNGIFAFAIWDTREHRLFAARDHMGVKPFYYAVDRDRFFFASEIKALLAAGLPASMNYSRLGEYLLFGAVAGEDTLFQGVRRLPPGGWLEFRPGARLKLGRYFDVLRTDGDGEISKAEAVRAVRSALETAVERQMVSDVPVGSMCSGGLDSSSVTALSARHNAGINTYCIKIPGPKYDESGYSHQVSVHCRTAHHELECRADDVAKLLSTVIWLHEEPLRHPNSVPIFQISRLAREAVTVLLSGEGADELFGGYYVHRRIVTVHRMHRWGPRPLLRLAQRWSGLIGRQGGQRATAAALALDRNELLVGMLTSAESALIHALAPDVSVDTSVRSTMAAAAWRCADGDPVQAAIFFDQLTYLPTLLDRQDKMCMGTSIESRVPFLDIDLVCLANRLRSQHKLRGQVHKAVLRDATADLLPEVINRRPKHGFGIPLLEWQAGAEPFRLLLDRLQDGELTRAGLLDRLTLAQMVKAVQQGDSTVTELIWNILNLEIWWGLFITQRLTPCLPELPAWRGKERLMYEAGRN